MMVGIQRHAVFVRSSFLAENLPCSLLSVAAPAHRLEVRSIKEESPVASMRLDVIDFGRHEPAPLALLTHRAERLLRQHPPAQPLPPVGAIPLPTTRELANAPAHSRTLQLAVHELRPSRVRV